MSHQELDDRMREIVHLRLQLYRMTHMFNEHASAVMVFKQECFELNAEVQRLRKETANWQESYHQLNEQVAKFIGRGKDSV